MVELPDLEVKELTAEEQEKLGANKQAAAYNSSLYWYGSCRRESCKSGAWKPAKAHHQKTLNFVYSMEAELVDGWTRF